MNRYNDIISDDDALRMRCSMCRLFYKVEFELEYAFVCAQCRRLHLVSYIQDHDSYGTYSRNPKEVDRKVYHEGLLRMTKLLIESSEMEIR